MKRLPTVTIDRDGSPVVINESDYDAEEHTLWDGGEETDNEQPKGGEPELVDEGKGWYSVKIDGETVSESKLRKADAEALIAELTAED